MTDVIDLERISALTNEELFRLMKEYNLNVGPITGTTRNLYEKKFRLHLTGLPKKQQTKENENMPKEPAAIKSSKTKKVAEKVAHSELEDTYTTITRQSIAGKQVTVMATETVGYTSEKPNEPSVLSNISNSRQSQREVESQQQHIGRRWDHEHDHVATGIPQWSQRDNEPQQQQSSRRWDHEHDHVPTASQQRSIEPQQQHQQSRDTEPKQQQQQRLREKEQQLLRDNELKQQLSRDSQQRDKRRDDNVSSSSSGSRYGADNNEESKTATKDDINIRFVRNDTTSQKFNTGRLSNTFSTPQTDKFAMRLNSYGLLKQDGNRSMLSSGLEHQQQRTSIQQKYVAADSTTSRLHNERRLSPRSRKSPENVKIFANSIIRDNQPAYNQTEQIKRPSPVRSRQSPENVKIFANSIIRDNLPYTNESKYSSAAQVPTATTTKPNDLGLNWKYLAAVGFMTILAYFTMVNVQYLFSNDEL